VDERYAVHAKKSTEIFDSGRFPCHDPNDPPATSESMRLPVLCGLLALLLPASAAAAPRVSAFYYPWYGTPGADGAYQHWQQEGHTPPAAIASNFFPARGVYSSSDRLVLNSQMTDIRHAGIADVSVSWWGWGSPEDARLPAVIAAARAQRLTVSVHVEPYAGRTPESVEADIEHLRGLGVTTFYVYRPFELPPDAWAPMNDRLTGVRVLAQTGLVGQAAAGHFDGVYTYDVLIYGAEAFPRLCQQAHAAGLACVPSVGPGYDARAAVRDPRVKPRRAGATYDAMWQSAIASGADAVTITSYNEWHEGTQIEPARDRQGFESYAGAWGLAGAKASTAYLDRTTWWSHQYGTCLALKRGTGMLAP
jgi:glycoprotein endo-alpha-1,2-mannosidase